MSWGCMPHTEDCVAKYPLVGTNKTGKMWWRRLTNQNQSGRQFLRRKLIDKLNQSFDGLAVSSLNRVPLMFTHKLFDTQMQWKMSER